MPLRVAAIDFLNPAPLMWDFHHAPHAERLNARYDVRTMPPAECARQLLDGRADLGLVPVAALTPELAIVPGCTIASLRKVRSIQLIVKGGLELPQVKTLAADLASRSSVAYAQVLFRHFLGSDPELLAMAADPVAMLARADAALIIGDPALLALENRAEIEQHAGPCTWHDVAGLWTTLTGHPWVAAVWAVRPAALDRAGMEPEELVDDLNRSRVHGLAHIEDLVREWVLRIALPAPTIRMYLTENIHYALDERSLAAITLFRRLAAQCAVLPELGKLHLLNTDAEASAASGPADATSGERSTSQAV